MLEAIKRPYIDINATHDGELQGSFKMRLQDQTHQLKTKYSAERKAILSTGSP